MIKLDKAKKQGERRVKSLGEKIKFLRVENNMKQETLAKLLYVTPKAISNYENDLRMPTLESINRLAQIFNTSTDYFVNLEKTESELYELKVNLNEGKTMFALFNEKKSKFLTPHIYTRIDLSKTGYHVGYKSLNRSVLFLEEVIIGDAYNGFVKYNLNKKTSEIEYDISSMDIENHGWLLRLYDTVEGGQEYVKDYIKGKTNYSLTTKFDIINNNGDIIFSSDNLFPRGTYTGLNKNNLFVVFNKTTGKHYLIDAFGNKHSKEYFSLSTLGFEGYWGSNVGWLNLYIDSDFHKSNIFFGVNKLDEKNYIHEIVGSNGDVILSYETDFMKINRKVVNNLIKSVEVASGLLEKNGVAVLRFCDEKILTSKQNFLQLLNVITKYAFNHKHLASNKNYAGEYVMDYIKNSLIYYHNILNHKNLITKEPNNKNDDFINNYIKEIKESLKKQNMELDRVDDYNYADNITKVLKVLRANVIES